MPPAATPSPRRPFFGTLAAGLSLLLLVGSVIWWAFALTFGLISGLVVLMAPLWPLLAQALVLGVVLSLGAWLRWERLAALVGLAVVGLPASGVVGWYGWQLWQCESAADPDACYAYLNGSPLLPALVGLTAVVALGEALFTLLFTWRVRALP